MNKERRKRLSDVSGMLFDAQHKLEWIIRDEDEARDNMPENLAGSERYSASEEISDLMESVLENLIDAQDLINEAINI